MLFKSILERTFVKDSSGFSINLSKKDSDNSESVSIFPEYHYRLLTNLLLCSLEDEAERLVCDNTDKLLSFDHPKRDKKRFIYNYFFSDNFPGRLERIYENPEFILNFASRKSKNQSGFVLSGGEYQIKVAKDSLLIKLLKEKKLLTEENNNGSETGSDNQFIFKDGNLSVSDQAWSDFFENLDFKELEKKLVDHQNQTALNNLKGDKQVADKDKKIKALKKFRDQIILNQDFFQSFTEGKQVLNTQQYFRFLANKINVCAQAALEDVNLDKWNKEFEFLKQEINHLLLIYDLKSQSEGFSYKKNILNLSERELEVIFNAFKKHSDSQSLNAELNALSFFNLLHYSNEGKEKEFALLKELCQNSENFKNLDRSQFLNHLSELCDFKIKTCNSVIWKSRLNGFLKSYFPQLSFLCPSSFRYCKSEESNLGSDLSASIRNDLSIEIEEEWKNFDHQDAVDFHCFYRREKNLLSFSDKAKRAQYKLGQAFRVFVFSIFLASTLVRISSIVCKKFHLLQDNKKAAALFLLSAALFNFLLVALFIDAVVGFFADKIIFLLLGTAQIVDQYLFGKFFSRIFSFARICLQKICSNLFSFFSNLFHNIGELGLLSGIKKSFCNLDLLSSIKDAPKDIFNLCDDFLFHYSKTEISTLPKTWRFNIFDPFSTLKKFYNLCCLDSQIGEDAFLINAISEFSSTTGQTNEQIRGACINALLLQDLDELGIKLSNFLKKHEAKNVCKNIKASLEENGLGVENINLVYYLARLVSVDDVSNQIQNSSQRSGQIKSINYALSAFKELEIIKIVERNEPAFALTKLHKKTINCLHIYKEILSSKGNIQKDFEDTIGRDTLQSTYSLLRDAYLASGRQPPKELNEFASNFDLSKLSDCHDAQSKKIADYIRAENGLNSITESAQDFVFGGVDRFLTPAGLAHTPLYMISKELKLFSFFIDFDLLTAAGINTRDALIEKHRLSEILMEISSHPGCTQEQQERYEILAGLLSGQEFEVMQKESINGIEVFLSCSNSFDKDSAFYQLKDFCNCFLSFLSSLFFIRSIKDEIYNKNKSEPEKSPSTRMASVNNNQLGNEAIINA